MLSCKANQIPEEAMRLLSLLVAAALAVTFHAVPPNAVAASNPAVVSIAAANGTTTSSDDSQKSVTLQANLKQIAEGGFLFNVNGDVANEIASELQATLHVPVFL